MTLGPRAKKEMNFLSRSRPARPPANASTPPSRAAPHDSGPLWFATPSTNETFIHNTLPVLTGARRMKHEIPSFCAVRCPDVALHRGFRAVRRAKVLRSCCAARGAEVLRNHEKPGGRGGRPRHRPGDARDVGGQADPRALRPAPDQLRRAVFLLKSTWKIDGP